MKPAMPQYVTDKNGNKVAVIISVIDYEEMIEDLHDFEVIAKRKKESTVSYENMRAKFKK